MDRIPKDLSEFSDLDLDELKIAVQAAIADIKNQLEWETDGDDEWAVSAIRAKRHYASDFSRICSEQGRRKKLRKEANIARSHKEKEDKAKVQSAFMHLVFEKYVDARELLIEAHRLAGVEYKE